MVVHTRCGSLGLALSLGPSADSPGLNFNQIEANSIFWLVVKPLLFACSHLAQN
jgi:hypothetical protein